MYHEIGSEFWTESLLTDVKRDNFDESNRGVLCGRTALDYIIRDAIATIGFKRVLLPSYCCDTMVEPFIRNGIEIRFYPVIADKEGLKCIFPRPKKEEVLYLMLYFGFEQINIYNQHTIRRWKFCILDETHSCFSKDKILYQEWNIKYSYASYRKWADIRGFAMVRKIGGKFQISCPDTKHDRYLKMKREACVAKQAYMEKGEGNKQIFLKMYSEAEEMLDIDYEGYASLQDGETVYRMLDIEKMREKRRENGTFLLRELKKIEGVKLMYPFMLEHCCPLCIPILVPNNFRDSLRIHLIENEIYCPVHWKISEFHNLESKAERELYEQELSIVCDQRYGILEMQRIVNCISDFFKTCRSG